MRSWARRVTRHQAVNHARSLDPRGRAVNYARAHSTVLGEPRRPSIFARWTRHSLLEGGPGWSKILGRVESRRKPEVSPSSHAKHAPAPSLLRTACRRAWTAPAASARSLGARARPARFTCISEIRAGGRPASPSQELVRHTLLLLAVTNVSLAVTMILAALGSPLMLAIGLTATHCARLLASGGHHLGRHAADQVAPSVRNLHQDPGHKLPRVDPLALRLLGLVMPAPCARRRPPASRE